MVAHPPRLGWYVGWDNPVSLRMMTDSEKGRQGTGPGGKGGEGLSGSGSSQDKEACDAHLDLS